MTPPAVFFFDYVDPLSFLVERRLAQAEASAGVRARRRPLELRPPPGPLLDPRDPAWRRYWEEVAEEARSEGLDLRQPDLVPWTRKAHELAFQAGEEGKFDEVHLTLFRAFLLEGRDIGRVDVLADLARSHGLDWTATRTALDVDKHAGAVSEARQEAERLGVRGVPTLLAGERRLEGLPDPAAILALLDGR